MIMQHGRIYPHAVLRVNYTSYDMRRCQDSLNPRTHPYVMVLSAEDDTRNPHPYWYARIIGVYHATVIHRTRQPDAKNMVFLHVRWLGRDLDYDSGFAARRLHRVGFVDGSDDAAFGFLDPDQIIRAVHMIPAFHYGQTDQLLGPSRLARQESELDLDWQYYYVNL